MIKLIRFDPLTNLFVLSDNESMKFLRFFFVFLFMFFSVTVTACLIKIEAATTGAVTATVSAQNIAIGVSSGVVIYGVVGTGGSKSTTASGTDETQIATNQGNVAETFNIKGQTAGGWNLASVAGSEAYFHRWCKTSCDATPTWYSLTTGYTTLATGISASAAQAFDLLVGAPSITTDYSTHSVDVTIQATE